MAPRTDCSDLQQPTDGAIVNSLVHSVSFAEKCMTDEGASASRYRDAGPPSTQKHVHAAQEQEHCYLRSRRCSRQRGRLSRCRVWLLAGCFLQGLEDHSAALRPQPKRGTRSPGRHM